MFRFVRLFTAFALTGAVIGCTSFVPTQVSSFVDDDGNKLVVEYGRGSEKHASTFVSLTGKEMEYKSDLGINMQLPDGKVVTAWRCMNAELPGTMYMSPDRRWKCLVTGISSMLFLYDEAVNDYALVFQGSMTDTRRIGKDAKQ